MPAQEHRPEFAVPQGADPKELTRLLHSAHEEFMETGRVSVQMRRIVLESWLRSMTAGHDPEKDFAPITLDDDSLAEIRRHHPLAEGMAVVRELLVASAIEGGMIVALSDAAGQLLWVEGARQLRDKAEHMNFVPGANWSEESAGTNAPGTALALGRPVALLGPEHLSRRVTSWSCSAAPIRDPDTGAILGVLDVTGGPEAASATSLGLVRATAAAIQAQLRIARLRGPDSAWAPGVGLAEGERPARLDVLGVRSAALLDEGQQIALTLRHSEILFLLAEAERGMTGAELAVALSDLDLPDVTIRAELSRLRQVTSQVRLVSRPYRLAEPLPTDAALVRSQLAAGSVRQAVATYTGPILPDSQAPKVCEAREELHMLVRSHLLASDDPDALLSFADTDHGRDDWEIWERTAAVLPASSPRRTQVLSHLERLGRALS